MCWRYSRSDGNTGYTTRTLETSRKCWWRVPWRRTEEYGMSINVAKAKFVTTTEEVLEVALGKEKFEQVKSFVWPGSMVTKKCELNQLHVHWIMTGHWGWCSGYNWRVNGGTCFKVFQKWHHVAVDEGIALDSDDILLRSLDVKQGRKQSLSRIIF